MFCDLAGSDTLGAQEELEARHLDRKKIDLSIRTLEKVLAVQVENERNTYAAKKPAPLPFRESKVTRILADCLTKKTLLIANIESPDQAQDAGL